MFLQWKIFLWLLIKHYVGKIQNTMSKSGATNVTKGTIINIKPLCIKKPLKLN